MKERSIFGVVLGFAIAAAGSAPGAPCQPGFTARPAFNVGPNGGMNALADLDGDGDLDLTTGHFIFLGEGDGSFGAPIAVQGAEWPVFDAAIVDFDGDGFVDMALSSFMQPFVTFLHGRDPSQVSKPLFGGPVNVTTMPVWHMVSADFNEDGRRDVFAVSAIVKEATLILSEGGRRYRPVGVAPLPTPGHPVATGDFDGDGHADVAFGSGNEVSLLYGKGNGSFRDPARSLLFIQGRPLSAHRFRAADLDGDGRSELAAIGDAYTLIYAGAYIGPAGLPIVPSVVLGPEAGTGRFLEIADINADGILDIAMLSALNQGSGRIRIHYGEEPRSKLTFTAGAPVSISTGGQGAVLGLGDVDGDGAIDIVITTEDSNRGQVLLNDGSCFLGAARGDANADGQLDIGDPIAALNHLLSSVAIPCPKAVEVNGDGQLDIADPVYLLNHLFTSGPAPVGPGPVACRGAG